LTIPLPKKKVLVVDDNPNQSKTMAILLQLMGMDVHVADDGPTALDAVKNLAPDVALIDIGLPGMDGYHLARLIRTLPEAENIKLIAQTGWARDEDREKAKDAGFDYHLTKPIDHKALEAILLT
jgi:CheY-like chemotaxis protein